jgi:hypothetical protein
MSRRFTVRCKAGLRPQARSESYSDLWKQSFYSFPSVNTRPIDFFNTCPPNCHKNRPVARA